MERREYLARLDRALRSVEPVPETPPLPRRRPVPRPVPAAAIT